MDSRKLRPIRVEGNIAYVPLTLGYEAVIDADDVCLVDMWNWHARVNKRKDGSIKTVYAARSEWLGDKAQRALYMHRVIANTSDGLTTDHKDGDGLNNTRQNLRGATVSQNGQNQRLGQRNTSGAKGVGWDKVRGKWRADIRINGKRSFLGYFITFDCAVAAYAVASSKVHGAFGRIN